MRTNADDDDDGTNHPPDNARRADGKSGKIQSVSCRRTSDVGARVFETTSTTQQTRALSLSLGVGSLRRSQDDTTQLSLTLARVFRRRRPLVVSVSSVSSFNVSGDRLCAVLWLLLLVALLCHTDA